MLKNKEIVNLFLDFCAKWSYYIERYDEFIGTLLLKHKKYCDYKDSYIFIDLCNTSIMAYTIFSSKPNDLFTDCLQYDEIRDLILVLSLTLKKLHMED